MRNQSLWVLGGVKTVLPIALSLSALFLRCERANAVFESYALCVRYLSPTA